MREPDASTQPPTGAPAGWGWLRVALLLLLIEKVTQHVVVTFAFVTDLGGIRASVAFPYQIFMVVGAVLAALFALAAWGLIQRSPWARALIIALALTDIVGEVVAQLNQLLTLNVSLLVATALLILALLYRQRGDTRADATHEEPAEWRPRPGSPTG